MKNRNRQTYQLYFLVFSLLLLGLTACRNKQKPEEKTVADSTAALSDSATTAQSIATEDSVRVFDNSAMVSFLHAFRPGRLLWSQFHLLDYGIQEDVLQPKPFHPESGFYTTYASVLRWAPDSSYILDNGSAYLMPEKDAKGHTRLVGGDPDTEIALINPKQGTKSRLLFLGPSSQVLRSQWVAKDEIAILGSFPQSGSNQNDTLLYLLNVNSQFLRTYRLQR